MEKTKQIPVTAEEEAVIKKLREDKIKALREQLRAEEERLASLEPQKSIPLFDLDAGYSKDMVLPKKIIYILEGAQKCLTAREIFNKIVAIEPEKNADSKLANKFYTDISSAIGTSIKGGRYFKRYLTEKGYKVGLLGWFDGADPRALYRND